MTPLFSAEELLFATYVDELTHISRVETHATPACGKAVRYLREPTDEDEMCQICYDLAVAWGENKIS
jgi:hypothetical protein